MKALPWPLGPSWEQPTYPPQTTLSFAIYTPLISAFFLFFKWTKSSLWSYCFHFFFFACSSPRSERTTDLYPLGFASNVPWAVPQYTLTTSLLHILFLSSQDSPLSVLNCSMFGFLIIFHELFEGTWLAHSCTLGPSSPRPSINTYWRMKEFWTLTFPYAPCSFLFQNTVPASGRFFPLWVLA